MPGKRPKSEEIVSKPRQVEVLQSQGKTAAEAIRSIGVYANGRTGLQDRTICQEIFFERLNQAFRPNVQFHACAFGGLAAAIRCAAIGCHAKKASPRMR